MFPLIGVIETMVIRMFCPARSARNRRGENIRPHAMPVGANP